jgi:hypothetical protein
MKEVKAEVKQNSKDILRLENKIDDKLSGLFDGHSANTEKLDTIDFKIDNFGSSCCQTLSI